MVNGEDPLSTPKKELKDRYWNGQEKKRGNHERGLRRARQVKKKETLIDFGFKKSLGARCRFEKNREGSTHKKSLFRPGRPNGTNEKLPRGGRKKMPSLPAPVKKEGKRVAP